MYMYTASPLDARADLSARAHWDSGVRRRAGQSVWHMQHMWCIFVYICDIAIFFRPFEQHKQQRQLLFLQDGALSRQCKHVRNMLLAFETARYPTACNRSSEKTRKATRKERALRENGRLTFRVFSRRSRERHAVDAKCHMVVLLDGRGRQCASGRRPVAGGR